MAPRMRGAAGATRLGAITAILRKDVALFSRDLLFVFLTVLSVVTFVTLYWVLPDDVDETISLGVHGGDIRAALTQLAGAEAEGLNLRWFDSNEALRAAVKEREIEIGLQFGDGFITDVTAGRETTVTVFVRPNLPEEITGAMESMVRELAYAIAGYQLPVTEPAEEYVVLGEDRAGDQIPFRDRLRPLYAFIVLILESISLAALISSEIQERTVTAILSTPARVGDIIIAKGALGAFVAFSEAAIILLLIRAYGPAPLIVLAALLLGAIMVTGVAMIAGSAGRELMDTMLLGMLFMIPLAIPGVAILFPGQPAAWVQFLPSYGIVQIVYGATVEGAGWAESAQQLLTLAGWCLAFGLAGVLVLKRRVETL
jgi:ABC-2 type transport system permease protein